MDLTEDVVGGNIRSFVDNFAKWDTFEDGGVGHSALKIARFVFDFAAKDNAAEPADNSAIGAHPTNVELPAHAIVVGGFFDVNTAFTSADAATIAISVEGANDIQTAASVAGAPYSTVGRKAIVPKFNTPETTSVKTTEARAITCTVADFVLTAGKLTGYLYWLPGSKSE